MTGEARSNAVDVREWERSDTLARFELLVDALRRDERLLRAGVAVVDLDARTLALLAAHLADAQRSLCTAPEHGVRLPAHVFREARVGGATQCVLAAALLFKHAHRWRQFQWGAPSRDALHRELLAAVRQALRDAGLWHEPRIAFARDMPPAQRESLSAIARAHGCEVVSSAAKATHLVLCDEADAAADDDTTEYLRTVARRDKQVKVHWWYYPDSYDQWLNESEVEGEPPRIDAHSGVWRVHARYLRDLAKFNEWPNEIDYEDAEYEEPAHDSSHSAAAAAASGGARKAAGRATKVKREAAAMHAPPSESAGAATSSTGSATPSAKRARHDDADDAAATTGGKLLRRRVTSASKYANVPSPYQTPRSGSAASVHRDAVDADDAETDHSHPLARFAAVLDDVQAAGLTTVEPSLVLPAHVAHWFRLDDVHEREKRALPEFFSGRSTVKTPAVYVEYRNFMVNTYQQNPELYLTQTACRRNLAGDVMAIVRVHQFLEHWGLINFAVQFDAALAVPSPMPLVAPLLTPAERLLRLQDSVLDAQAQRRGGASVAASGEHEQATLAASEPAALAPPSQASHAGDAEGDSDAAVRAAAQAVSAAADSVLGAGADKASVRCGSCETACGDLYFRASLRDKGNAAGAVADVLELCAACYADGRFPSYVHSGAFVRCGDEGDAAARLDGDYLSEWSTEETLRLLEALEQYGTRWQLVARHVGGNKSPRACVRQFLRLPCTEPYKAAQPVEAPFSRAANPILSLVAFLSESVDPQVAAAAATAAADVIDKMQREQGDEAANDDEREREVHSASAAALAAASARALRLAQGEEMRMRELTMQLVEEKLKALESKVSAFAEMENELEAARARLADERKQIVTQIYEQKKRMLEAEQLKSSGTARASTQRSQQAPSRRAEAASAAAGAAGSAASAQSNGTGHSGLAALGGAQQSFSFGGKQ